MLDPTAFKAYDVRALYPSQLDEAGAYAIGRAFADQFEPRRIAVGRDVRLSSPAIAEAVISGVADAGVAVADLGMVGTEMVYFATGELGLDGGIMVTASHNPKQYTGLKIVRRGALPVGSESGLVEVRERALRGEWREAVRGEVAPVDVWDAFVARVLSFVDLDAIAPLRVVVDAANGMAGEMLPRVLAHLPQVEVVRCYFDPDGKLPQPRAQPLLPRTGSSSSSAPARRRPRSASPTTATPTAASSSTTWGSSCPATSSPRFFPSWCSPASRARR